MRGATVPAAVARADALRIILSLRITTKLAAANVRVSALQNASSPGHLLTTRGPATAAQILALARRNPSGRRGAFSFSESSPCVCRVQLHVCASLGRA